MLSFSFKKNIRKKGSYPKYIKCNRCGYVTIVNDSSCPICIKDGLSIKMI